MELQNKSLTGTDMRRKGIYCVISKQFLLLVNRGDMPGGEPVLERVAGLYAVPLPLPGHSARPRRFNFRVVDTTLRFYEGKCQEQYFASELKPDFCRGIQPRSLAVCRGCPVMRSRVIADQREAQGSG